jgi:hypothetical protein
MPIFVECVFVPSGSEMAAQSNMVPSGAAIKWSESVTTGNKTTNSVPTTSQAVADSNIHDHQLTVTADEIGFLTVGPQASVTPTGQIRRKLAAGEKRVLAVKAGQGAAWSTT